MHRRAGLVPPLAIFFILIFSVLPCQQVSALYADGTRYAFAASPSEQSIAVIDLQNHTLAGSISLDKPFGSITASDKLKAVIIASPAVNSLTLIDLLSPGLDRYEYPLSLSPDYIRLSPLGDTLAVYDRTNKSLEIHAVRRRENLVRIEDVNADTEMTFKSDGSAIYWVDRSTGTLHMADLWSNTATLKLAENNHRLSALSRSIDGRFGFISNADAAMVYVVDLNNMKLVDNIETGKNPGRPWGTMDGTGMLIPNSGDNSITVLSAFMLEKVQTLDVISRPATVTTGWLDSTAAVISDSGDIGLLDLDSGELVTHFHFTGSPGETVITSDSRVLAVAFKNPGRIVIFDMQTRSLLTTISDLPDISGISLAISGNLCH